MGTILRNSDWELLPTVKKGNIGENKVQRFLEEKGYVCYQAITEKAHPFDFLCVKDKREAIAAEVKTKALRTYYQDTGFNKNQYEDYKAFSEKHKMPIFLFFVDEYRKQIYGNWLSKLDIPITVTAANGQIRDYPREEQNKWNKLIRYYHFSQMRQIATFTDVEAEELKMLSNRSYAYAV